jgi:hypothetical protein
VDKRERAKKDKNNGSQRRRRNKGARRNRCTRSSPGRREGRRLLDRSTAATLQAPPIEAEGSYQDSWKGGNGTSKKLVMVRTGSSCTHNCALGSRCQRIPAWCRDWESCARRVRRSRGSCVSAKRDGVSSLSPAPLIPNRLAQTQLFGDQASELLRLHLLSTLSIR